jgi:hypothetical protein
VVHNADNITELFLAAPQVSVTGQEIPSSFVLVLTSQRFNPEGSLSLSRNYSICPYREANQCSPSKEKMLREIIFRLCSPLKTF